MFPSSDDVRVKLRFARPTWRVIQCAFSALESELRKRDEYDLTAVTQLGEVYTLFLRKKAAIRDKESL